jgi:hypothetical protein
LVASPSPRQFASPAEPAASLVGSRRAARQARRNRLGSAAQPTRQSLELIQGSLSPRRIERQAPWLAGLHRAADGTLAGLGVCMLALSGLTLHWQNHWGQSYQRLEDSQVLGHRMQESAAVLEQHHLGAVRKPGWLVPTSSEKLIYLPAPKAERAANPVALMAGVELRQIPTGY